MSRRSQAARVYEDFQPKSEWREEQENHILTVYIPGFTKDQINITCKRSARKLLLQGERGLEKNRWSQFNQVFPIPENCNLEKLDAWWQKGVLTITMPKEERKAAPEEDSAPPVPSTVSAMKQTDKQSHEVEQSPSEKDKENNDHKAAAASNGLPMTKIKKEDGKWIVNLGMAFLVIMALVAYLSYRLRSKRQTSRACS